MSYTISPWVDSLCCFGSGQFGCSCHRLVLGLDCRPRCECRRLSCCFSFQPCFVSLRHFPMNSGNQRRLLPRWRTCFGFRRLILGGLLQSCLLVRTAWSVLPSSWHHHLWRLLRRPPPVVLLIERDYLMLRFWSAVS